MQYVHILLTITEQMCDYPTSYACLMMVFNIYDWISMDIEYVYSSLCIFLNNRQDTS